ncbi:Phototropin-2 [Neolecta irregularis DAH-3]|uniref:Phototropin-2 n=1 Tax=Neolecta irregularis (strain DAH-3) TaxID=1198029 RepID=A0A1U7LK02_NEOID|nr:Phototropin-2 [Neolecta irregularis DAH-3]|eukprot:OLL22851.1 Phototropin-2 [Neolecta irregularis DAH-3]
MNAATRDVLHRVQLAHSKHNDCHIHNIFESDGDMESIMDMISSGKLFESPTPSTSSSGFTLDFFEQINESILRNVQRSMPKLSIQEDSQSDALNLVSERAFLEALADSQGRKVFRSWLALRKRAHLLDRWILLHHHQTTTVYLNALSNTISKEYPDLPRSSNPRPSPLATMCASAQKELYEIDFPEYLRDRMASFISQKSYEKITGFDGPRVSRSVQGLCECFCLTNPSHLDNPIVLVSDGFLKVTGYDRHEIINQGRLHCRLLQGPATNPSCVSRLKKAIMNGVEHTELLLNYRKDGVPFFNLLFVAPLRDEYDKIQYFLGGQINVTAMLHKSRRFLFFNEDNVHSEEAHDAGLHYTEHDDCFLYKSKSKRKSSSEERQRLVISKQDLNEDLIDNHQDSLDQNIMKLKATYRKYVILRQDPTLTILFVSPSLQLKHSTLSGTSFSELLRTSTPTQILDGLSGTLRLGQAVSAKIIWHGQRWIHATPLKSLNDEVGLWVVIIGDVKK